MFRTVSEDDEPIERRFTEFSSHEVTKLQRQLRERLRTPLDILIEREEMMEELKLCYDRLIENEKAKRRLAKKVKRRRKTRKTA